jgi:hypothetical protein
MCVQPSLILWTTIATVICCTCFYLCVIIFIVRVLFSELHQFFLNTNILKMERGYEFNTYTTSENQTPPLIDICCRPVEYEVEGTVAASPAEVYAAALAISPYAFVDKDILKKVRQTSTSGKGLSVGTEYEFKAWPGKPNSRDKSRYENDSCHPQQVSGFVRLDELTLNTHLGVKVNLGGSQAFQRSIAAHQEDISISIVSMGTESTDVLMNVRFKTGNCCQEWPFMLYCLVPCICPCYCFMQPMCYGEKKRLVTKQGKKNMEHILQCIKQYAEGNRGKPPEQTMVDGYGRQIMQEHNKPSSSANMFGDMVFTEN